MERTPFHLDAAVAAGFNDCVALHVAPVRPLRDDPRFRALYTAASVDNVGRLDTGVSLLPQAPCRPANRTPSAS
ncbi:MULTISPECIES: hypothetical protein [Streptomyces]|uniref:hypothetical protein n=1 Tax=Streptomyces TaxID=1883 RepID=UPI000691582A|nr:MULTISPECIES: hypothetical protein [Streptomyces]